MGSTTLLASLALGTPLLEGGLERFRWAIFAAVDNCMRVVLCRVEPDFAADTRCRQ